eukprot:Nk52_evm23s2568 gene=Nk52_evmTU23s2568
MSNNSSYIDEGRFPPPATSGAADTEVIDLLDDDDDNREDQSRGDTKSTASVARRNSPKLRVIDLTLLSHEEGGTSFAIDLTTCDSQSPPKEIKNTESDTGIVNDVDNLEVQFTGSNMGIYSADSSYASSPGIGGVNGKGPQKYWEVVEIEDEEEEEEEEEDYVDLTRKNSLNGSVTSSPASPSAFSNIMPRPSGSPHAASSSWDATSKVSYKANGADKPYSKGKSPLGRGSNAFHSVSSTLQSGLEQQQVESRKRRTRNPDFCPGKSTWADVGLTQDILNRYIDSGMEFDKFREPKVEELVTVMCEMVLFSKAYCNPGEWAYLKQMGKEEKEILVVSCRDDILGAVNREAAKFIRILMADKSCTKVDFEVDIPLDWNKMDKGSDFFCIRIWGLPELKTYLTDYLRGVFSPINGEFYGDAWNNTPDANFMVMCGTILQMLVLLSD